MDNLEKAKRKYLKVSEELLLTTDSKEIKKIEKRLNGIEDLINLLENECEGDLNKLTYLTSEMAEIISQLKFKDRVVGLGGLKTLDEESALALREFEGRVIYSLKISDVSKEVLDILLN